MIQTTVRLSSARWAAASAPPTPWPVCSGERLSYPIRIVRHVEEVDVDTNSNSASAPVQEAQADETQADATASRSAFVKAVAASGASREVVAAAQQAVTEEVLDLADDCRPGSVARARSR